MVIVRRLVPVFLVASLALLALNTAVAAAAAPAGPRLAVQSFRPYPDLSAIHTVGPNGEDPRLLVGGEDDDVIGPNLSQPAWSPDGSLLAFTSSRGEYSPVPYVVGATGGKPRLVAKTTPLSDPIFTADGRWLAFPVLRVVKGEFKRPHLRARDDDYGVVVDFAILKTSLDGSRVRKVTGWKRRQRLTPTSFSPDGRYLAAERYSGRGEDAVLIDLKSRKVRVIARDAEEPVFSPDGTRIAYVRTRNRPPPEPEGNRPPGSSALLVTAANLKGESKRIARIKGGLAWPSWDPSSSRIAFTRLEGGERFIPSTPSQGNSVMQINADGTCLGTLLKMEGEGHYEGVAWQPGPGRGAGPIVC
jgi:Tol biopolymer transport system component